MTRDERSVARKAKAMTRQEVIMKAVEGRITWTQAAEILRLTPRHLRRVRERFEQLGSRGLLDGRAGCERTTKISEDVLREVCRLKRDVYPDFSVRHFHEQLTGKHGISLSYTWTKDVLQAAGVVTKEPGRGRYRRRRERRAMVGMMLHLDASTHPWLPDLPSQDLVVMLDDADGRILFARFFEQEGTLSTLIALKHVLLRWGRFCELYTDRGSHFCLTTKAEAGPNAVQHGQVPRVLRTLGIRHILARSPEARGRSERAFGTIQGRLPQELRVAGVTTYAAANEYLDATFVPDFNRRFTVKPRELERAFTSLAGTDLELVLTIQHERVVRNDHTVTAGPLTLQLPPSRERVSFARCPVTVHEFLDGTLGVSFQGKVLAHYDQTGELIRRVRRSEKAA
jgi:winged helix-turn helix protein